MTIVSDGFCATAHPGGGNAIDPARVRKDFPILQRMVNGHPLVYLDNAATAQKPQVVIDALSGYYASYNANIRRGVHALSLRATRAYEQARVKVHKFVGASRAEEIDVLVAGVRRAVDVLG